MLFPIAVRRERRKEKVKDRVPPITLVVRIMREATTQGMKEVVTKKKPKRDCTEAVGRRL